MEYTILELAKLAGVTTRTLRYYEQITLLEPAGRKENGYRLYTQAEVNALQLILFYKELGLELSAIKGIMKNPEFDRLAVLEEHLGKLILKRKQIDKLIINVSHTLEEAKGARTMDNQEKFYGLKEDLVKENEEKYGVEIRQKYGEKALVNSNAKFMNLTEEQYDSMTKLGLELNQLLEEAVNCRQSPYEKVGRRVHELHKEWLSYTWPTYSKEAHIGLTQMYIADERFKKYYDEHTEGCAEFLKEAVAFFS